MVEAENNCIRHNGTAYPHGGLNYVCTPYYAVPRRTITSLSTFSCCFAALRRISYQDPDLWAWMKHKFVGLDTRHRLQTSLRPRFESQDSLREKSEWNDHNSPEYYPRISKPEDDINQPWGASSGKSAMSSNGKERQNKNFMNLSSQSQPLPQRSDKTRLKISIKMKLTKNNDVFNVCCHDWIIFFMRALV